MVINDCELTKEDEEYYRRVYREVTEECQQNDPVCSHCQYRYFTSRSKGRGRKRRNWKEIELVSYRGGPFHLWHNFPFDVYATEVLGYIEDATEKFKDRIRSLV